MLQDVCLVSRLYRPAPPGLSTVRVQVRHGDLKSKNVLLTKGCAVAKLSDVGMARILTTTQSVAEVGFTAYE